MSPNSPEGPIAEATAAIEARQYDEARAALEPLLRQGRLTQRVATLMARIEGEQHGDKGRVREWLARAVNAPRDPAWTADGVVADRWAPISPVTGALDAFQWRVPVESMDSGDGEMLAAKLEELVALGGPTGGSQPTRLPPPERRWRKRRRSRSCPSPSPCAKLSRQKPEPTAPTGMPAEVPKKTTSGETRARASRLPPGRAHRNPRCRRPRRGERKEPPASETRRKHASRAFSWRRHAPDDPGPETAGQDDIAPLRPKPA